MAISRNLIRVMALASRLPSYSLLYMGACRVRFQMSNSLLTYVYFGDVLGAQISSQAEDEVRRIAANIAKLPELLGKS
jgi:hypothetical protein